MYENLTDIEKFFRPRELNPKLLKNSTDLPTEFLLVNQCEVMGNDYIGIFKCKDDAWDFALKWEMETPYVLELPRYK
jgi:hypothetical protein